MGIVRNHSDMIKTGHLSGYLGRTRAVNSLRSITKQAKLTNEPSVFDTKKPAYKGGFFKNTFADQD